MIESVPIDPRVTSCSSLPMPYSPGMSRPHLDQRVDRFITTVKLPLTLKLQVDDYASRMGIPINSAMIVLLDRSLQAAGFPGVSGPAPTSSHDS